LILLRKLKTNAKECISERLLPFPEPTSQDAKTRVQHGVHPPPYITNVGGEPRVKPGVWRPEMWAQISLLPWHTLGTVL
jgi:hypothetical protein